MLIFLVVLSIFIIILTRIIKYYNQKKLEKEKKKSESSKSRSIELEIDEDSLIKYYQRENIFD